MEQRKIDIPIAKNLDQQEREIILARNGERIRMMPESSVGRELSILITKTHIACGQPINEGVVSLGMTMLLEDIIKYFGTLTMSEITQAFRLGTMGEFGEWFGLNNKTYLQWCKGYMGWQKRTEANKKQMVYNAELNKPKELTQDEKDKIIADGVLIVFEEFKKTGFIYDAGNVTYNYLDSKGLIPFTVDRKKEIVKLAEAQVRIALTDKMAAAISQIERAAFKSELGSISYKDEKVRTECKRIGLNIFFKELIETGTELKDLL